MADSNAKRICLILLSFLVYAGMMALVVLSTFSFGQHFGLFLNTTGDMLQKYHLPLTPTRLLYDYWYLLYGLQIFFHAYTFSTLCRKAQSDTPIPMYRLSLCPSVMFSLCIANNLAVILWLFLWDRQYTVAALLVIAVAPTTFYIAFYYTCRGLYLDLALLHNSKANGESWAVRILVHNIIGFLAAWMTLSFVFSFGVVLVNEIQIDVGITCLALLGALVLELLIWLWVDVFFLDDFTRYTISTYFPMIVVTIALVVEVSAVSEWTRFKICVIVATALSLICLVVKLIFLIYRHRMKPFLKVIKPHKKADDSVAAAEEENQVDGKNGNGSVTVVTVEEKKSSKPQTKNEAQTKAIVNELHTKFEGGSKPSKEKQDDDITVDQISHYCEQPTEETTVEVVQEVQSETPQQNQVSIEVLNENKIVEVEEAEVVEETGVHEEPELPPVDYDIEEDLEAKNETSRTENVMPVPHPMELTRENVEIVSHNADAKGFVSEEIFRQNETSESAAVNTGSVELVDDNTNTSHASVEAQGSEDENEVDDFSQLPPPAENIEEPQDYENENKTEPNDYPPAPEALDIPEVPVCEDEAGSNSFEKDMVAQELEHSGNGFHDDMQRSDIDGTAKTLEEESDDEVPPVKFAPNDPDIVEAEVHSYENGENLGNYKNGIENEYIQTDSNKVYEMPEENSDCLYDSSDEGEVTLA